MAIKSLTTLIAPPEKPLEVEGNWQEAEKALGIEFPTDFRELIERYGTGEFDLQSLLVSNPLSEAGRKEIARGLWTLEQLRDALELTWSIHPERPGYLPWGKDSNGNIFCWWTQGEPDNWPIVQLGHNDEEHPQRAEVDITTFLVNYARNKYPQMQGGNKFKKSNYRFEVGRPWERYRR
jgi:hypothetical protein